MYLKTETQFNDIIPTYRHRAQIYTNTFIRVHCFGLNVRIDILSILAILGPVARFLIRWNKYNK